MAIAASEWVSDQVSCKSYQHFRGSAWVGISVGEANQAGRWDN